LVECDHGLRSCVNLAAPESSSLFGWVVCRSL
jgi:hypothetical protein